MNRATRDTCPLHIWKHEVHTAAIAAGADAEVIRESEINAMVIRWYQAGEPVWMAADSLVFVAKRHAIEKRADREVEGLRRAVRKS